MDCTFKMIKVQTFYGQHTFYLFVKMYNYMYILIHKYSPINSVTTLRLIPNYLVFSLCSCHFTGVCLFWWTKKKIFYFVNSLDYPIAILSKWTTKDWIDSLPTTPHPDNLQKQEPKISQTKTLTQPEGNSIHLNYR